MVKKSTKIAVSVFSLVSTIAFFTTSSVFAAYLNGKWEISPVRYENVNLEKKYAEVLWASADAWNGIAYNLDLYPSTEKKPAQIEVRHVSRNSDERLGRSGTYAVGIPYDKYGNDDVHPYASGDLIIVRYLSDKLDDHKTTNLIIHEFGHILGLAHNNKVSIMNESYVFKSSIYGPTAFDKTNLINLYD
ncbi:matrixin family metalloprotease [Brevibacillus ruminantium]|uniref:Matrixin family metalloprotease n=1 Tax=Brevibacillus ruminantium TaxID=2950604 RepID=A0ABY4WKI7_9BACL|nr:matrixin family metalloprotease [Brevibacillus ruminantium]USG67678.1 matrixin family metalloprotease [Brevibacillus ruminantium]